MIAIEQLTIGFEKHPLLRDANCKINNGELTALLGRNGTGKSTLLRAIAGLNKLWEGDIIVDGKSIRDCSPKLMSRKLAYVSTTRPRIADMRCRDVVAMGRAPFTNWIGNLSDKDKSAVEKALDDVGMLSFADKTLDTMSDGECQRIMIARALAQAADNILLDEPTSFLDLPNRYALCKLLSELAHEYGKCILFSTHELDIALKLCDSIVLIDNFLLSHISCAGTEARQMICTCFDINI